MTVKITNARGVAADLRQHARNVRDLSPAFDRVGNYMESRINRQFMTEGAYFGTPWRRLTPRYKAWKMRHGGGGKILVLTGDMKSSFKRPMDAEVITPTSAILGSNNQKAIWHHYGTHKDGKRINPPRKIVVVTRQMRADILDIINRWIMSHGGPR